MDVFGPIMVRMSCIWLPIHVQCCWKHTALISSSLVTPIVHQEEEMDDSVVMNCSNLRKHWCMVSCCNKGVSLLMLSDRFLHFLFHAFLFIVIQIGRT